MQIDRSCVFRTDPVLCHDVVLLRNCTVLPEGLEDLLFYRTRFSGRSPQEIRVPAFHSDAGELM